MRSALSLTLILCLVSAAVPVAAQEQTERAGPLARAIMIEAVRVAAASETTSSSVDAVQPGGTSAPSDWSRVLNVAPGTEVIVTVRGSQPGTRYVVLADESDLTVLNLTDPTLPGAARDVLLFVAAHHPEYFTAAQKGGQFVLEKNARVGPEGVFIADRKVADLGQIVENVARNDIAEIKTPRSELRGFRERYPAAVILPRSDWHVFVGVLAGSLAGGMIGGVVDCRVSSCGPGGHQIPTGVFVGALAGAIVGGVLGHRWRRAPSHKTDEEVIHRAP